MNGKGFGVRFGAIFLVYWVKYYKIKKFKTGALAAYWSNKQGINYRK